MADADYTPRIADGFLAQRMASLPALMIVGPRAVGERLRAGVVLHTGPSAYQLDERILAAPICAAWG
ncbi:MAG: hypothetical protein ABR549_14220 [Mycobacteriales bacterium]